MLVNGNIVYVVNDGPAEKMRLNALKDMYTTQRQQKET